MHPDQKPEQMPVRPSWLARLGYLAGMMLLTYGMVGLAGWLLQDHLPPGPLLAALLAVVAVISVVAAWLEPYVMGTYRWQRQVRLAVADLLGVLRTTQPGEPLWDERSNAVLHVHHNRIPPGWAIEVVPLGPVCEATGELAAGEPVSSIPHRKIIVVGRSASAYDDVIPIRRTDDGRVKEIPQPATTWRQEFRSHRLRNRLGTLDASPAELRELAEQLARAVPVPDGDQDAG